MHATQDIDELIRAIPCLTPEQEISFSPWLQDVKTVLGVRNVAMYSPVPRDSRWDLSFGEWAGHAWEERGERFARFVRSFSTESADFVAYDPFAVEKEQRNRVLSQTDLVALDPKNGRTHARTHAAVGITGDHQLRVLLCDGPRLLAWFGVFQHDPFETHQYQALRALVEPLREQLTLRHRLRAEGLRGAILNVLLEQMAEAVFVLRSNGQVELINDAAELLLTSTEGRAEFATLRRAVRARQACARYHLSTLRLPGLPEHRLAIRQRQPLPHSVAVARAVRSWKLTPKLALVLERASAGASNKEIANVLGCAEVTVERHVTALLRVAGVRSRTELVAKVHRL